MKVFIIASLVALAAAQQYPAPAPAYKQDYKNEYRPYNFEWAVKDDASYNDYNHQQYSDASGNTQGSYRTLLPDGRIQTVTYNVSPYGGYVADVKYEGEARYDYKPAYKAPAAYPAPGYKTPAYPAQPAYRN
ncbi:uncharacterized protein LOC136033751 [Artemia franciscana]|uniref:Cuticle protein n=1 Tax=Artemia franciscana TaxID=6661 RepID=A0AA88LB80_ARTSF|nr:hypothetical protein QYM36_002368 [Artemia franciscana]